MRTIKNTCACSRFSIDVSMTLFKQTRTRRALAPTNAPWRCTDRGPRSPRRRGAPIRRENYSNEGPFHNTPAPTRISQSHATPRCPCRDSSIFIPKAWSATSYAAQRLSGKNTPRGTPGEKHPTPHRPGRWGREKQPPIQNQRTGETPWQDLLPTRYGLMIYRIQTEKVKPEKQKINGK